MLEASPLSDVWRGCDYNQFPALVKELLGVPVDNRRASVCARAAGPEDPDGQARFFVSGLLVFFAGVATLLCPAADGSVAAMPLAV